ncbi:hypothetical protein L195_g025046 [Trifolium pratense]|uniref:CCHC-type domain-containing protein n=1 Tax=Trifolium pratense TaxID=57577 RepID=A0A2K3NFC8_TRIPR|nr:hypothetical protein L195_g025046 [Trifolium pratense]
MHSLHYMNVVENGVNALSVSSGRGGGRGRKAKGKGGDKWNCFHCQKKGHFKRDCSELKDNNSAHVVEGSSEYEGYENGEALVVSSDDARDGGELEDFRVAVSEEEGSGIVGPKGDDHGDLVVGCKGSLMLQLVEPPKIPGRTDLATPGAKEGAVNLVGATKHPMIVGGKIFMRVKVIPRDEGEVKDGESSTVVDGITVDLKGRWTIVEYALKSWSHKVGKQVQEL